MSDDAIREAVAAADTYKDAAAALGLPYSAVYDRSRRLGVFPKRIAEKRARREAVPQTPCAPSPPSFALREPVPEPTPPVLGPWIPPGNMPVRENVARVRLDQQGRVRAEVSDLGNDWAGWAIRDAAGRTVGKLGLRGGLRPGEAIRDCERGADEDLVERAWLPAGFVPATTPCEMPAVACCPDEPRIAPDMTEALCVVFLAGTNIAIPAGWSEERFVKLARWCFQREKKARITEEKTS